ncbi:hypothetical protein CVT25_008284 [Psilocybe cyanescens]|uniref:Uncharacterized protein n=1 Tax=Psilocybe cyanescens TaxID=93625 RepID=A0A409XJK7_PSICY|nr:hypothetical protein CVT25_008284 [Psilocybe cyanescens]
MSVPTHRFLIVEIQSIRLNCNVDPAYALRALHPPAQHHHLYAPRMLRRGHVHPQAHPHVNPDDRKRVMGWDLQKTHKDRKQKRERGRGVVELERGDQERSVRMSRQKVGGAKMLSTTVVMHTVIATHSMAPPLTPGIVSALEGKLTLV